jgi:hypothetical protein
VSEALQSRSSTISTSRYGAFLDAEVGANAGMKTLVLVFADDGP